MRRIRRSLKMAPSVRPMKYDEEMMPMTVADSPAASNCRVVREEMKALPMQTTNKPRRGPSTRANNCRDMKSSNPKSAKKSGVTGRPIGKAKGDAHGLPGCLPGPGGGNAMRWGASRQPRAGRGAVWNPARIVALFAGPARRTQRVPGRGPAASARPWPRCNSRALSPSSFRPGIWKPGPRSAHCSGPTWGSACCP
ncbi:hypothetical protein D3C71_1289840 [compost metagenome]